ncbi:hypothetical protein TWF694_011398 [Orbilia ellipsospora]|uniref:Uncharacterized protein n=1 Tax=Orbilia ellipsospora TaxID=2528407 RepID=A0AAV9X6H7_9PEZI
MHSFKLLTLFPLSALAAFNLLSLPDDSDFPTLPNVTTTNPACIAAYNATIDCDFQILNISISDSLPTESELDSICTSTCLTSLRNWVRGGPGCSGEAFLDYFGVDVEHFLDDNTTTTLPDVWQYYITSEYWSKCLTNLNPQPNESKYCLLTGDNGFTNSLIYNTSSPSTLCQDNNCGTQSAYLWAPVKMIYEYDPKNKSIVEGDEDLPMITLEQACPGLDTSKYPVREADVTAEMLGGSTGGTSGGSSGGSSGNGTPGGNSTNSDGKKSEGVIGGVDRIMVWTGLVLAGLGYLVL